MKNLLINSIAVFMVFLAMSCGKQTDYEVDFTTFVLSKTNTEATIETSIVSPNDITTRGFIYTMQNSDPYIYSYIGGTYIAGQYSTFPEGTTITEGGKIVNTANTTDKTYELVNLIPDTKYYVRSFAISDGLVKYSNVKSFTTD